MTLRLRYAARSHTGLLRPLNEDSVYAGPRLLAVADGMGGHAAGEVASAVAIAAVAPLDADVPGSDLLQALRERARTANAHLRQMVAGDAELEGMGTTLVALLFNGNRIGLLHIGDSRCYLLREGELSQITRDHTFVQALIDEGRISEAEASTHPQRSVITKVLDGHDDVEPDLSVREVRAGDRYLLCSDGLTGPVGSQDTLLDALQIPDVQESCERLLNLALRGGGPDNITLVVADVVDDEEPAEIPVVAGAAAESPQEPPPGIAESAAGKAQLAERRDTPGVSRLVTVPLPRRKRSVAAVLAVLLILVLGALGVFLYARSQYYVGLDKGQVVIYRGVPGSVAGVHLSSVQARTTLSAQRLDDVDQDRLGHGIVATGEADARAIVQRLIATVCPTPTPAPTPHATAPAGTAAKSPSPAPSPTPCP